MDVEAPASPTAGQPTIDTHDLLDDDASKDEVLQTKHLSSPAKKRKTVTTG